MNEALKVGIWIRVSTDEQARGDSPQNHRLRAITHAEDKGWDVVEIYNLSGVSGKSVIDHHEARRMLHDVETGRIKGLVFSKLARLARNTKELIEIAEHFKKHDAALVSLDDSRFDTSTPLGQMFYTVIAALSQWEREEISARVAASVPVRASQGKPLGGLGPFGYVWRDPESGKSSAELSVLRAADPLHFRMPPLKLVIDETHKATIIKAFDLFLKNRKILATCTALNKAGIYARRGQWTPPTLKRILADPVYKGKYRANRAKSLGEGKGWIEKPEAEWVWYDVDPIVSEKVWNAAQKLLADISAPHAKIAPRDREGKYTYSGILTCNCGKKMYVYPYPAMKSPRYACKACKNKINEDQIDALFVSAINNIALEIAQLEPLAGNDTDTIATKIAQMKRLRRDAAQNQRDIDQIFRLNSVGALPDAGFAERYATLNARKTLLAEQIATTEAEIADAKIAVENVAYMHQQAVTILELWPKLEYAERRGMVESLVERVSVENDTKKLGFIFYRTPHLTNQLSFPLVANTEKNGNNVTQG